MISLLRISAKVGFMKMSGGSKDKWRLVGRKIVRSVYDRYRD